MTSCRSSRRASLPYAGGTIPALAFRPLRGRALPRAVFRSWSPGNSGRDLVSGNDRISYVPGEPHCALALLSDPGRTNASGRYNAPARPPLCPRRRLPHSYFRGSITRLRHWLSTLRRPGRPDTTQDSLPAAGQALPDGLGYPQGSIERFQGVSYIHPPFPSSTYARTRLSFSRPILPILAASPP